MNVIKFQIVIIFILILSISLSGYTQFDSSQNYILEDRLDQQISKLPNDIFKVDSILILCQELRKINPIKSLSYSKQGFELAKKLDYQQGVIDALQQIGKSYEAMGEYDSARISIIEAMELSISINDIKRVAQNKLIQGNLIYRTSGPEKASKFYEEGYDLFYSIGDSTGMAKAVLGIGAMFVKLSEYDSAAFYLIKYIKLCEALKDEPGLGKGYINLAHTYIDMNEFDEAKKYLLKSIPINEKYNNKSLLALTYNLLGAIEFENNNFEASREHYTKALDIYKALGDQSGIAGRYTNLANIFIEEGKYDQAINNYDRALEIYLQIDNKEGIVIAYKNQGWVNQLSKNYAEAMLIYDSCLSMANRYNLTPQELEIRANIFKLYEDKGEYRKAFRELVQYYSLKDSIFNLEKEGTIADLLLKYGKEKDSVKILNLENDKLVMKDTIRQKTMQRNRYIYAGSGTILVFVFFFAYYRQRTRKNKIISDQRIKQLEEEKKLLAARSIVEGQEEERKRIARELHDGLGVLLSTAKMQFTTIRDKSPENQNMIEKATKLLEQASGDVRRISHNMMPGLLTKYGFYEAVEDLIEQIDENEGIHAVAEIRGECKRLSENTEIMLYRIVQELVNNTLKYAEAQNILLEIDVTTDKLKFTYSDDGKGFDVLEKLSSKSIGLTSIQSRVKFLGGDLEMESSTGAGVRYTFEITC